MGDHEQTAAILAVLAMGAFGVLACGGGGGGGGGPQPAHFHGVVGMAGGGALDDLATVSLPPEPSGTSIDVTVEANGTFSKDLDPGTYTLTVTRIGYQDLVTPGFILVEGENPNDLDLTKLPAQYMGSLACQACHAELYTSFRETGHPYKISKVVNGTVPTFPFTDITGALEGISDDDQDIAGGLVDPIVGTDNQLGTPQDYFDISYVIGGYNWKVRWIDLDGYIVTGTGVQYNLATGSYVAYHNNQTDIPFNCGNCHTTGWRHYDATNNDARQDDLPGMDGTFTETGIGCEACHGAGGVHVQTMRAVDITEYATPRTTADFLATDMGFGRAIACSECHTRDGEKDYPTYVSAGHSASLAAGTGGLPEGGRIAASGGLIRHHEQFDEILGIDPDTMLTVRDDPSSAMWDCKTCHDPHKSAVNGDVAPSGSGVKNANSDCLACHAGREQNNSFAMKDFKCITCHMPRLDKSAVATQTAAGSRVALGDIRSHIFRIDLSKLDQITSDGKFAYPRISGPNVCRQCHHDQAGGEFPLSDSAIQNYKFHQ